MVEHRCNAGGGKGAGVDARAPSTAIRGYLHRRRWLETAQTVYCAAATRDKKSLLGDLAVIWSVTYFCTFRTVCDVPLWNVKKYVVLDDVFYNGITRRRTRQQRT